jgi:uncharacterized protein
VTFGTDLLHSFGVLGGRRALPKVRALHLPRCKACEGKQSAFCALELEGGILGLAYIGLGDSRERLAAVEASVLRGGDPMTLLNGCAATDEAQRVLGLATANALTRWLFDRAGFVPPESRDSLGGIRAGKEERVGMVGLFLPLLDRVLASGAELTVLELPPEPPGERGGWRVTLDAEDLAPCTRVLCTSTVLLNDTLEHVRAACRSAREFALIGPGASCLPDPLFARGVTRLGGSWVTDAAGVIDALETGERWTAHACKFDLGQGEYPGFEALLERLKG